MFSDQIVFYLFIGGTTGGMLCIACMWSLAMAHSHKPLRAEHRLAFRQLFTRCLVVGLLGVCAALLCLLSDLGKPDRALQLFVSPTGAVLSWGVLFLTSELLLVGFLAVSYALGLHVPPKLLRGAEALCAAVSVAVFIYTGVYLYSLEAVAFWHFPVLVAVFALSSLSAGFSLMLLIAYFTPGSAHTLGAVKPLQRLHLCAIALEALAIACLVFQQASAPAAAASFSLFTSQSMLPWAAVGVGGFALAVPFCLETYSLRSPGGREIPASDIICIAGALILRYVIAACGMH